MTTDELLKRWMEVILEKQRILEGMYPEIAQGDQLDRIAENYFTGPVPGVNYDENGNRATPDQEFRKILLKKHRQESCQHENKQKVDLFTSTVIECKDCGKVIG